MIKNILLIVVVLSVLRQISGETPRILPVGNSITDGDYTTYSAAYRYKLQDSLGVGNYNFVGPYRSESDGIHDSDHAGASGEYITTIVGRLKSYCNGTYLPNASKQYVLLMAGTNDVAGIVDTSTYHWRIDSILHAADSVLRYDTDSTWIVIATIPPMKNSIVTKRIYFFNGLLYDSIKSRDNSHIKIAPVYEYMFIGDPTFAGYYNWSHPGDADVKYMASAFKYGMFNDYTNTIRRWNSTGSTDMSLSTNYTDSGELSSVNDICFDSTSNINASATGNLSVKSIAETATYSGNLSWNGYSVTTGGSVLLKGNGGALDIGNGITAGGTNLYIGAGIGATSITGTITLNNTTGVTASINKDISISKIITGDNSIVSWGGTGTVTLKSTSKPITTGANSSFTILKTLCPFNLRDGGDGWEIGTGTVLNIPGAATYLSYRIYTGISIFPALTATGNGNISISTWGVNSGISFTGNQNYSTLALFLATYQASGAATINLGNYDHAFGVLSVGSGVASSVGNMSFGSGTLSISAFDGLTYNTGTFNLDFQTKNIFCFGNWSFGSNSNVSGDWSVTFNGAAAATVTTTNKSFNNVIVNKTANGLTTSGVLRCDSLVLTDGTFAQTAATDTVYAVNAVVNTADAVTNTASWAVSNKLAIAEGVTLTMPSLIMGGTAGHPDTISGGTLDFTGNVRDTASYMVVGPLTLAAGDTLDLTDGTSVKTGETVGAVLWPPSDTPVISSIVPIWQKRGATFKLKGTHFKSSQGYGTMYLGTSNLLNAATWSDTLIIDTIPASWSQKGTYNVIIKNSDYNRDTTQIRVLIPTITPMEP